MSSLSPRPTDHPPLRPEAPAAHARTPSLHLVDTPPVPVRPPSTLALAGKRGVDIALSLVFFAVMGWLYAVVWLGVRITSGGPAIYTQPRHGRDGRVFTFYKFRSMVRDADAVLTAHLRTDAHAYAQWQTYQKLEHDPRITRFGAFIRRYSLDELPQMWNVLRGDMSLVGPRPVVRKELDCFYGADAAKMYESVKPGLTGPWQVGGRSDTSYEERVAFDCDYVRNCSTWGDIKLIARTASSVLTGKGSY